MKNGLLKNIVKWTLVLVLSIGIFFLLLYITYLFYHGDYSKVGALWGYILACLLVSGVQMFTIDKIPVYCVFSLSYSSIRKKRLLYVLVILPILSALCGLIYSAICLSFYKHSLYIRDVDSSDIMFAVILASIWLFISLIVGIRQVFCRKKIMEIATTLYDKGEKYGQKGAHSKAISYYTRSISTYDMCNSKIDSARAYIGLCTIYIEDELPGVARVYAKIALDIYEEKGSTIYWEDIAKCYYLIGISYSEDDDYKSADSFQRKALDVYEQYETSPSDFGAVLYDAIGGISFMNEDYHGALEYFDKALKIRKQILEEDSTELSESYNKAGRLHLLFADYEQAKVLFERSLTLRKHSMVEDKLSIADSLDCMGLVFEEQGNIDEALHYFQKSLEIRNKFLEEEYSEIGPFLFLYRRNILYEKRV